MNDKIKGAFDTIKSGDELKKNTREFLSQKTRGYKRKVFFPYRWLTVAAKCTLFAVICFGGYSLYFTPTSVISLDVNPSIELGVNRFDRVVSIDTYYEGFDTTEPSINVRFLNYKDAIEQILADENMTPYVNQGQFMAVTVFGSSEEKSSEMLSELSACTASYNNVFCFSGNRQEVADAHSEGMSFGKYRAFLELNALDPEIMPKDVKELTMGQIWNEIRMLSSEPVWDIEEEENLVDKTENGESPFEEGIKNGIGNQGSDNKPDESGDENNNRPDESEDKDDSEPDSSETEDNNRPDESEDKDDSKPDQSETEDNNRPDELEDKDDSKLDPSETENNNRPDELEDKDDSEPDQSEDEDNNKPDELDDKNNGKFDETEGDLNNSSDKTDNDESNKTESENNVTGDTAGSGNAGWNGGGHGHGYGHHREN